MSAKPYRVFRIDPAKKAVAPLALDPRKPDYALALQKLCRAKSLGHRFLCEVDGRRLCVTSDSQAEEGQPGWRLRGVEGVTAGIGVLFGQGEETGGFVGAPVDRAWIMQHIVWTSPAETDEGGGA